MRTLLVSIIAATGTSGADVHFGNGIKIGEVDSSSAIVWLRLTDAPERRAEGTPFKAEDEKVPDDLTWKQCLAIFREQFPTWEQERQPCE